MMSDRTPENIVDHVLYSYSLYVEGDYPRAVPITSEMRDAILAALRDAGYPLERLPELLAMRERVLDASKRPMAGNNSLQFESMWRYVLGVTEGET